MVSRAEIVAVKYATAASTTPSRSSPWISVARLFRFPLEIELVRELTPQIHPEPRPGAVGIRDGEGWGVDDGDDERSGTGDAGGRCRLRFCREGAGSPCRCQYEIENDAATKPDPDLPEAYTIFEPEAYVDVLALEAILRDFSDTFASLDLGRVFIATFSYGSHVADQVVCSRSSMVRGVASITGSWLTRRQFGADGAIGGPDGALECGSGHEPGFFTLTGQNSDPYGRRSQEGFPSETGELHNRVPIFRAIGLADHNLTEGLTATVAASAMAQLNGVENRVSSVKPLKDIDRSTEDGKAMTLAKYRRPARGERRRTRASLEIGQCGLSSGRGQPAFDPRVVPGVDGLGCAHGIWGNDDNVGNDQAWPTLAVRFFSRL